MRLQHITTTGRFTDGRRVIVYARCGRFDGDGWFIHLELGRQAFSLTRGLWR